ncbi:MAG: winged helix-turn-helix transcriptional regulator [Oscillospiraceae bacterium]|nr:winged helix-turn-helix transcriptional regulator [Oscillospiraceae bacterium]
MTLPIGGQSAESADRAPIESNGKTEQIIEFIVKNGNATSTQLANYTGLSQRRVREILNELIDNDTVIKIGNYRHTNYTLKIQKQNK